MSLNSLWDKAVSVANVAGKKTEEMVEVSKLKLQEVSVNAELEDCYQKIGSLVYRSKKSGVSNEQEIEQVIAQVDDLLVQLTELQMKRDELKKTKKCPNCGASCTTDSHFCSRCGMAVATEVVVSEPNVSEPNVSETVAEPAEETTAETEEKPLIEETL